MYNDKRIVAIVCQRMTSTRLPGKALLPLAGKPVTQHIIERLRKSKYIDEVVIAMPDSEEEQPLVDLCNALKCKMFKGSKNDVLTRVLDCAKYYQADVIVDVTGDCPLCDSELIDKGIEVHIKDDADHTSNVAERTMPRGFDYQVFNIETLIRINEEVDNEVDRQHVTSWCYLNPKSNDDYVINNIFIDDDLSHIRLTLDTEEDYKLLSLIFEMFDSVGLEMIRQLSKHQPYKDMLKINQHTEQKNYYKELAECYLKRS